MSGDWHLYLLRCRDGSYYAGITTDVARRFRQHAEGRGAKYTRAHPPDCVLGSRAYPDRSSASRAEHALKRCAVALCNHCFHAADHRLVGGEFTQQRFAIRQADVTPHFG